MFYHRNIYESLLQHCDKKQFTIITGARQTGKTTLLKELEKHLRTNGKEVYYLSLENRSVLTEVNRHPDNLFRFIPAESGTGSKRYICIDEIQYASDPTNFLKYLYDSYHEKIKIIATGSSAFYIDEKFTDSLAGRKDIFNLYTLNFEEYLFFSNRASLLPELNRIRSSSENLTVHKPELNRLFEEYLVYGGYPGVVLEDRPEHKTGRLEELRDSFLKRDILESSVKNETDFFRLFTLLAEQVSGLVNTNELAGTLKIRNEIVKEYLTIMQKCFHVELIRPFHSNLRKELVKMPKAYFNDLGMRNILLEDLSPLTRRADKGSLLENYTFLRLRDRYRCKLNYWRTADGNEIDFIITRGGRPVQAYEVKFNGSKFNGTRFRKFTDTYQGVELECISFNGEGDSFPVIRV